MLLLLDTTVRIRPPPPHQRDAPRNGSVVVFCRDKMLAGIAGQMLYTGEGMEMVLFGGVVYEKGVRIAGAVIDGHTAC